jgi:hypothetical protein
LQQQQQQYETQIKQLVTNYETKIQELQQQQQQSQSISLVPYVREKTFHFN